MLSPADRRRSLDDLEEAGWGDPPPGSTRLVAAVHRLRQKPVGELSSEDLRLLIGQHVSLHRLVPLAIEQLREAPLAGGDLYEGDLLAAVLRAGTGFWRRNPALAGEVRSILGTLEEPSDDLVVDIARFEREAAELRRPTRRRELDADGLFGTEDRVGDDGRVDPRP